MREILFRGKSVTDGRWVFGDLSNYGDCKTITIVKDFLIIDSCEVIPETVGQYTGLKDKSGTRIFEGDIVKVADEYIDYAIWANGCFCMARQIMFYEFTYQDSNRMEVIGNVYDNQEILKGERENNGVYVLSETKEETNNG